LDIRIDKKWYFKKWALNAYIDIQNIYNFESEGLPYIDVRKDESGIPIEDPSDASKYLTYLIDNPNGIILPSIGLMIEF